MMMNLLLAVLQVLVTVSVTSSLQDPDAGDSTWSLSEPYQDVPVLQFPESSVELKRRKREWAIPPINIPENVRGPFPKQIAQIKSSKAKDVKITYSITGGGADRPPVGLFTINRNTGWLYVTKPLDREVRDKYWLQVHTEAAEGEGEAPMKVVVNVIDMNDNKPVFTQDTFRGFVPEAATLGFEFMKVTATDADEPNSDNADIRYSIISQTPTEPHPKMFDINPVTGGIRVAANGLDIEKHPKYTLEIQAADMQGHGLKTTGNAVITLAGKNNHAPQFENTSYTVSVPEIALGAVVVKLRVKDEDEPQTPAWTARFRIINGTSDGLFSVSTGPCKQEGIITTAKPLDFEQEKQHTLLVIVKNDIPFSQPLPTSTATVTVNVQNVVEPEEKCKFQSKQSKSYEVCGVENVKKAIVYPSEHSAPTLSNERNVTLHIPGDGLEIAGSMTLMCSAFRHNFLENCRCRPCMDELEDSGMSEFLMLKDKFSEVLVTVSVTSPLQDPDAGDSTWSLSEPYQDVPVLQFPESSVELKRRKRWSIPPITIPENDRGPFPKQIVHVNSDKSKDVKITYSITGEGADLPPVGLFTINRNTGWLYVTKALDREAKDKYVLQVHAVAAEGVGESPLEIIVNVIDMNDDKPVFTQDTFHGFVPEAATLGFEFMKVTATDADDPNTDNAEIRYSIISQNPAMPQSHMFAINPVTGAIRVVAKGLDREKYPKYTLEIQAADMKGHGLRTPGKAVITVAGNNNHAPQFENSSYTASVPEIALGAVVVKLRVKDEDEPQTPAWTAKFRILNGTSDGLFSVSTGPSKHEGIITTAKPLDFEQEKQHTLLVIVENDIPFSKPLPTSTATVTVNVLNVVEPGEKYKYGLEIAGSMTLTHCAFRHDFLENLQFSRKTCSCSRECSFSPEIFRYSDNSVRAGGVLKEVILRVRVAVFFVAGPEALSEVSFMLWVLVTVSVTSPLQDPDAGDSTWSLSEPYQDVPVLQLPESSVGEKRRKRGCILIPPIYIPENDKGPFPKQIVQMKSSKAKDVKITYSITGEGADLPPVGLFTINRNTGWFYVTKTLDREVKDKYELQVHAVAAEGEVEHPLPDLVVVFDMNDNEPVFTQDTFHGFVPEAATLGFEFMKVTATDADDPRTDNADIRYSIISQTPTEPHLKMFDINPVTGGIRVAAKGLDREKHPKYTLEIQAADMQGHGLTATGKAVITLTDINDNAPQFENTSYTASVPEIALGAVVVKLRVKDEDEPQTPAWTAKFRILNGKSDGLFSVSTGPSKQEGIITTAKPLDFEQEKQHTLLVIVENDIPFSKPLPTSTATVTVNVVNIVEPEEKCTCEA
ncbi:uncharacterized protein [Hoplias malabaricus]|uniref:uncharacterized protein n=1 Tax=Hoplias malabaricus TaxID=27720 RepID=UPI00346213FC